MGPERGLAPGDRLQPEGVTQSLRTMPGEAGTAAPPGLAGEEIDVLFLDHFFLLGEIGPDLVRDHINPKHIVMMHLRPEERGEVRLQVQALFPDAVVFDAPMETRVFE